MEENRHYLNLFLGEVREHLSKLSDLFLHIEKHPDDKETIEKAFMEMHTIKGDSAMVGLKEVSRLAHEAEGLLSDLRKGVVDSPGSHVDALFGYLDRIGALIGATDGAEIGIEGGKSASTRTLKKQETSKMREIETALGIVDKSMSRAAEALIGEDATVLHLNPKKNVAEEKSERSGIERDDRDCQPLEKNKEEGSEEGLHLSFFGRSDDKYERKDPVQTSTAIESADGQPGRFIIKIYNEIDPPLRAVRSFAILKVLFESGNLISTEPPNERLASGDFGEEIKAEVVTRDIKSAVESLSGIPGVKRVEFERVESGSIEKEKAPLVEKALLIDQLVSSVETESKEDMSARIKLDSSKGRCKVEEIRVNIISLDKLFNLAGELVLAKSRLGNIAKKINSSEMKDLQHFIDGVVSELQTEVMNLRLMPIGQVFGVLPRMVRDLSKSLGKEVDLVIEGGDTTVDRKVVEGIVDAVVHLVRNCIDHGIELPEERVSNGKQAVGTIRISASRDSSHFILEIEDDGKGMNPNQIRETAVARGLITEKRASEMDEEDLLYLTCMPGFSTKKCVSEISGRGVGMSAVKTKIESFGGFFSIYSKVGKGTRFTIRLPASMATMKVVVIGVGKDSYLYAIPATDISEIVEISKGDIKFIQGSPYINLRGEIIRLYRLAWLLKIEEGVCDSYYAIIIKRAEGRDYAILVSEIRDEDEVAIKPVPKLLRGVKGFIGSTILGDGKPAFVLDVMTIV